MNPATNGHRPRCHCGFVLVAAPGRRAPCCPVHMPALRQDWRRRQRRRVLRRRPVPAPQHAPVPRMVATEVFMDPETGQARLVEA